jgi:alpha-amylase
LVREWQGGRTYGQLLAARRDHAYGEQRDWLDHPNCIGWTRAGSPAHPRGLAVLMSNGDAGSKWMATGKANAAREVIWFSPHCLKPDASAQLSILDGLL